MKTSVVKSASVNHIKFLESGEFADATIECDDHVIKCHRLVLCQSTFFELWLNSDFPGGTDGGVMKIKSLDYATLYKILLYLYGDNITVEGEETVEILEAGHLLGIQQLCDGIGANMFSQIQASIAITLWIYAKQFDVMVLTEKCIKYCSEHFKIQYDDSNGLCCTMAMAFLEADADLVSYKHCVP